MIYSVTFLNLLFIFEFEIQFRTCLGTLNIKFSEEEIGQLICKYKLDSGLINYSDFCSNVDFVFSDNADPNQIIENSKSTANFSDDEKDTLLALLSAIRTEITFKRVLIKP